MVVLGLFVWIIMQTREVSVQTSVVLTAAAEGAAEANRFEQSLRLAVLAAKASWLHPAHPGAADALARAADGSTLRTLLIGHESAVSSASYSPDGKRVVTASQDKTARIWDAETGKAVRIPMTHDDEVSYASFSPDGKRVVTVSQNKIVRVWNAYWSIFDRPKRLIAEVCLKKLRGNVRILTPADVVAAHILPDDSVAKDVCDGVATPGTH